MLELRGFSDEEKSRILTIYFGEPGESARYLSQETKDEIALIVFGALKRAENYPPEQKEDILMLHKQVDSNNIVTDVMIARDGTVFIQVMHKAGYDLKSMPFVNHSWIAWDSDRKQWLFQGFHTMRKYQTLFNEFRSGKTDADSMISVVLRDSPWEEKYFGSLKNAIKYARKWAKIVHPTYDLKVTETAKIEFREIPNEVSLDIDDVDLLETAMQWVEGELPSLHDLMVSMNMKQQLN